MRKVLLVDDSVLFQKIVTLMFAQRNEIELVYTSSYKESELILQSGEKFFAAIVCIVLPDAMDGEMVDLALFYNIPTLVLTSSIGENIRNKMSKKPIIDYVSKNTRNDIIYAAELIQTLLYFEHRKVLIVTDDEVQRRQMSHFFSTLMLRSVIAKGPKEALEMIKNDTSIEIITTDYAMSEMDGLKFVQAIRGKYTKEQKIIFAFSEAKEQNINALFLKYGVNEIISKPFSKEEFNARVFKELDFKKTVNEIKRVNKTIEQYVITSTTDEKGIIRQVSDAFSEVSGYSKQELIGKPQSIVRHPDTSSELFRDLWKTIQDGRKWRGILKNRKKDGGYYWVDAHIEPIFNSEGSITGYHAIRQDITAEKEVQEKSVMLEEAKKNITDSIRFSSLIQHALLPSDETISEYLSDFFVLWEPKDIVGGDIYQFLEREDDCLIFVIDCTGHGVPGAFMTMVTKTVIQSIVNDENFANPALIMQELSKNIQKTLKQDNPESKSDAGFDGGILYFNKKDKRILYAGAKTPLFYVQNGELQVYKGDRESVGYKKSRVDFEFTNFELKVDDDSYFYITTDGFIDQNGGDGGFVLGKKKVQKLIEDNYKKNFALQKDIFQTYLHSYQGKHERDDDVTLFAFSIVNSMEKKVEHFLSYNGIITQDKLGEIESELERDVHGVFEHSRKKEKLLTIFYELGQNIIKYGTQNPDADLSLLPVFEFSYNYVNDEFMITCKNLISKEAKVKIASRIEEANAVEREDIARVYKELRKSNKYAHENGAGLGFFEFAKRSTQKIRYSFDEVQTDGFYYKITITI